MSNVRGVWTGIVRMKRGWRLPGAEADTGDELAVTAGRMQRKRPAITRNHETVAGDPGDEHLQTLEGRIDESSGASAGAPSSPSTCHGSSAWRSVRWMARSESSPTSGKPELEMRREPLGRAARSRRGSDSSITSSKSSATKYGSMKRSCSSVPHRVRLGCVRLVPEACDQGANEQLLRAAHARVGRHLERAQFEEPAPAR